MSTPKSKQATNDVVIYTDVKMVIHNTEDKWVPNQSFARSTVEYNLQDNTVSITLPKTSPPSDITKLQTGAFTGIFSKHNNRSDKYEIQFSLTTERLRNIGKTVARRELLGVFDAIWADMGEA